MDTGLILKEVKVAIKAVDAGSQAILFGSRARGDNNDSSDWDFLILAEKELSIELEDAFRDVMYDLELEYEQVFSLFLFSKVAWNLGASPSPLYDNIRKEGVMI